MTKKHFHILLIEDNPDDVIAIYLETLLRIIKFNTIRAADGLEAYRIFEETEMLT
jgi:CheY-like chemotaxis protein